MVLETERQGEATREILAAQKKQLKEILKRLHPDPGLHFSANRNEISPLKDTLSRLAIELYKINGDDEEINKDTDWPDSQHIPHQLTFPAQKPDGTVIKTTLSFKNNSPHFILKALQKYSDDPVAFVQKSLDYRDAKKAAAEKTSGQSESKTPRYSGSESERRRALYESIQRAQSKYRQERDSILLNQVETELNRLWQMRIIHLPQWEKDPMHFKKVPIQNLVSTINALEAGIEGSGLQWLIDVANPDKSRIEISNVSILNSVPPYIDVRTRNEHFDVWVQTGTSLTREQAVDIFQEIFQRIQKAMNPGDFAILKIRSIQAFLLPYRVRTVHDFGEFENRQPFEAEKFLSEVAKFVTSRAFESANLDALWVAVPEPRPGIRNVFSASYKRLAEIRDNVLYADPGATDADMIKALGR